VQTQRTPPAASAGQKTIDFFALPAEIRNNIYKILADHERDTDQHARCPIWADISSSRHGRRVENSLRSVCRQARFEYTPILHADIAMFLRFSYSHNDGWCTYDKKLLWALDEHVFRSTRCFVISFPPGLLMEVISIWHERARKG